MVDIVSRIQQLLDKEKPFALARVIKTWRSSPRPVGSAMLITDDGEMHGSVSGGCIETTVVKGALEVIMSGQSKVMDFGVADEEAWEVGLSCGGSVSVLITPFMEDDAYVKFLRFLDKNKPFFILTRLNGPSHSNPIYLDRMEDELAGNPVLVNNINNAFESGLTGAIVESRAGDEYFAHFFRAKPRLILIGSAHITSELLVLASMHDFETIVIDPRDTFAKKTSRQQEPNQLIVKWPQEVLGEMDLDQNTFAVILSHDPKIDDEALKIILLSEVKYVGALGSKKTHAKRVERLKTYGFSEDEIARIDAPIGIDIGSQTPKEIAISVMGALIKAKNA